MHHKTREAAVKKMKEQNPNITDAEITMELNKMEDNGKVNDETEEAAAPDELKIAKARIAELEAKLATPASTIANVVGTPTAPVVMKRYDMWKGEFVLSSPKTLPGTGQTLYRRVQFQFTDSKPKKSVSVTEKDAELWNSTRFTVRKQTTELLFPAGKKLDYWWIYNEETETHEFVAKELETA